MTFNFVIPEMNIGGEGTPTLQFYKRGFNLGGNGTSPSWQDIILSGNTALTLTNALANGLNYLKLFGGTEQRNLPSGYTQVEYIESNGTQYINTGVIANSENVIMKLIVANGNTDTGIIIGARESTSPYNGLLCGYISSGNCSMWLGNSWAMDNIDTTFNTITFERDDANYEYVASKTSSGSTTGSAISNMEVQLFANSGTSLRACKLKYCYLKIGNQEFKGIPALRNSDNALGLYDLVSNTFLTNAGTGTFTAGADVVPTPDTPMDIVCNNGVVKYGYKSVNMFDKNSTLEDGVIWTPNGETGPLLKYYGTNQIHVIGGHTYTRSGSHGGANYIKLSDGTWINQADSSATITMPDDAILWVFNNTTATSRDTMMIVEGTSLPAEYVPYKGYGIYTDGTTETVEVTGKNLFNENDITLGYFYNDSGTYESNANTFTSSKIPMNAGTTVTFSRSLVAGNVYLRIHAFNSSNNWIGLVAKSPSTSSLMCEGTTPANTSYIRVCGAKRAGDDEIDHECQVELGSTATAYEPYFNGGTATAEMLLAVGSYQDEQEVLTGNVTRNVGIKVLDGTESFDTSVADMYLTANILDVDISQSRRVVCSHFQSADTLPAIGFRQDYAVLHSSGGLLFGATVAYPTVSLFKQFLTQQYANGTPVIVVYPLATATTETVTAQPLTTQAGTNVVEITQGSIDGLGLEVSYKATV